MSRNIKQSVHFTIFSYCFFKYDLEKPGCLEVKEYIDGLSTHTFQLRQPGRATYINFPSNLAYPTGQVPIKMKKITDIKKCVQFVEEEHKNFYDLILQWPKIEGDNADD
ncbi:unnamed protein product [Psylliodes chrysocephalus]|uniref:Uncharacterized protein n=1 Tax=Psylliodes chrysocephalus TaxID=3402493 RepID=A0A9P0GEY2_9CUCU|nr:unnamed protein product [Psylliodes chrysocephala]